MNIDLEKLELIIGVLENHPIVKKVVIHISQGGDPVLPPQQYVSLYRVNTAGKPNSRVKVRATADPGVGAVGYVYHNSLLGGPGVEIGDFARIEAVLEGNSADFVPGFVELEYLDDA